jgi:hypothetical protein
MRLSRKAGFLLISSCALASAAVAGVAAEELHVMTIALPDGSVEHIRYSGDVAPKVVFVPVSAVSPVALFDSFDAPFAAMDRMMAEMDRQHAAMMREVALLSAQPDGGMAQPNLVAASQMPAGSVSYSFISTSNGRESCSQSWQITSNGAGQKPRMISQSSGNCATASHKSAPAVRSQPAPVVRTQPSEPLRQLLPVKYDGASVPAPAKVDHRT